MPCARASMANSWPLIAAIRLSLRFSVVAASSCSILPIGIPVQSEMTWLTSSGPTSKCTSGLPWRIASSCSWHSAIAARTCCSSSSAYGLASLSASCSLSVDSGSPNTMALRRSRSAIICSICAFSCCHCAC